MVLELKDIHISYASVKAARGVNIRINPHEIVALVGRSGCGKSTIAEAILGLLPVKPERGQILFNGEDLLEKTSRQMEGIRGKEIGLISQHVMTALHPTKSIGAQIIETLKQHKKISRAEARKETLALLDRVQLSSNCIAAYPHELSGGMRQRAMIALAICCGPYLLIADEPTTALDVTIQAQILELLQEIKYTTLFITHDLKLVAGLCDRVYVMDEGIVIETGTTEEIFYTPHHPVTQNLLTQKPTLLSAPALNPKPLLEVHSITKEYHKAAAVNEVSFTLCERETLGLIGESGCGKSTLGKMVAGLIAPTKGKVVSQGKKAVQMVFQDPYGSLNPRMRVREIVSEGLEIHRLNKKGRVEELLSLVRLPTNFLSRYPHELSGGERQRVGIARALAVEPKLLICDEPLSSLDMTTQRQMVELLIELQKQFDLSYLFISHDLTLLQQIAHRVMVMYRGSVVEEGSAEDLFANPQHPYTKALLSAIPEANPARERSRKKFLLKGDLTPLEKRQKGCVFSDRCPLARKECSQTVPLVHEVEKGHYTSCHLINDTQAH